MEEEIGKNYGMVIYRNSTQKKTTEKIDGIYGGRLEYNRS